MNPLLSMRRVTLGYGQLPVLCVEALTLRPAEAWFVLGPNGAGKTTLVRGVMGLLTPLNGRIERDAALTPQRISFVPQGCESHDTLPTTLREFVSLGLIGLRIERTARAQRVQQALERVGLASHARADFWTLSGGQRQRALLARALVRDPLLLVLDEPTNGLDPSAEEGLLRILDDLRRTTGLTSIFVTHDIPLAARHATHIALVHDESIHSGPRDAMVTDERLTQAFGVNPLVLTP